MAKELSSSIFRRSSFSSTTLAAGLLLSQIGLAATQATQSGQVISPTIQTQKSEAAPR